MEAEREQALLLATAELGHVEDHRPEHVAGGAEDLVVQPHCGQGVETVADEQQLFVERSRVAEVSDRQSRYATFGALAAQLILLGAVIFVSERQAQRRLAAESRATQAVARSRAVVQNVREPILLLDPSLRLLMTNSAFREVYGGGDDDATGAGLVTLGNGVWDDSVLLQRLADVSGRGRELWDYELAQRTGGVERVVLVNARRIELPEAGANAILLTVNDVTARKRSEQRILELNRELESQVAQVSEINRELEAFSYSVSHDLRAPLRHIAGFADKLGTHLGEGADEKAHHYLEVIGSSARRMSALIEDLLLYSRLGRNALRLQPVDMAPLVEEMRAMLADEAAGRVIHWRIGGLPVVYADETMMRQVWQNLLSNAVKYTSRREKAQIEVGVERSGADEIVFFVKDNGTGFDMEYATKLFGVFQRLHKASDFPGTGIGLANVRRIIGRHGGRTWADGVVNGGATFFFSLPVVTDATT
jgi:PAS domain S-box-containing protein